MLVVNARYLDIDIWNFFKICDGDITKTKCNLCEDILVRGEKTLRDFNTVNLQRNVNNKHSQEFEKYKNDLKNQKPGS